MHTSCTMTPVIAGSGLNPQDRQCLDVTGAPDDEVVVQVELMRKSVGKKVRESRRKNMRVGRVGMVIAKTIPY